MCENIQSQDDNVCQEVNVQLCFSGGKAKASLESTK